MAYTKPNLGQEFTDEGYLKPRYIGTFENTYLPVHFLSEERKPWGMRLGSKWLGKHHIYPDHAIYTFFRTLDMCLPVYRITLYSTLLN